MLTRAVLTCAPRGGHDDRGSVFLTTESASATDLRVFRWRAAPPARRTPGVSGAIRSSGEAITGSEWRNGVVGATARSMARLEVVPVWLRQRRCAYQLDHGCGEPSQQIERVIRRKT